MVGAVRKANPIVSYVMVITAKEVAALVVTKLLVAIAFFARNNR